MASSEHSPLAWELAQHAKLDNPAGTISATIYVEVYEGGSGRIGTPIAGYGVTADEAKRNLAHNLDRWAQETA